MEIYPTKTGKVGVDITNEARPSHPRTALNIVIDTEPLLDLYRHIVRVLYYCVKAQPSHRIPKSHLFSRLG